MCLCYKYNITGALFAPKLHDVMASGSVAPAGRINVVEIVASNGKPFPLNPLMCFKPVIIDPDTACIDPVPKDIIPAKDPVIEDPAVKNAPLIFTGMFAILFYL